MLARSKHSIFVSTKTQRQKAMTGKLVTKKITTPSFLGRNHACRKKSVQRLPRFRLDREMGLVDELKIDGLFGSETAELILGSL